MNTILQQVIVTLQNFLPLKVDSVSWDGAVLQIGGESWHFNCVSPWRIVTEFHLVKGCDEEDAGEFLKSLLHRYVVLVSSDREPSLDPVLGFDNGLHLQVFSIHPLDPWTFVTPNGLMYVPSPSDPKQAIPSNEGGQ